MPVEFSNFNEKVKELDILDTPVDRLDLPLRARNILASKHFKTIRDVIQFGLENIKNIKNAGKKTSRAISMAIEPFIQRSVNISDKENDSIEIEKTKRNDFKSFEEFVKNTFDKKLLKTPIEDLNLPTRAFHALKKIGLRTIEDIVNYELQPLKKMKNVGTKSIEDIKNSILDITNNASNELPTSFYEALKNIFSNIPAKYLPIIKLRYGFNDGRWSTYEEIGNKIGVTRERIRQIIEKVLRLIKSRRERKILEILIENLERLLLQYNGIISLNDILNDGYFSSGTRIQIKFLMNLISDLYEEQYRVIKGNFLTNLNGDEIKKINSKIQEVAIRSNFPIEEKIFMKNLLSLLNSISEEYICYQLIYAERIEISNGMVLSLGSKLSLSQKVKHIMREINYPMHYTEITKLYKERFGYGKEYADLEHAIHARVADSKDFLIVDRGTFILTEKFKIPSNIDEIVEASKQILRDLGNISDTKFLLKKLQQRNINIGNLNEYSLKPILLRYPDFVGYRKFEIGLEELADISKRKSLSGLIYEILLSAHRELHAKEIWRQISKHRGYQRYIIEHSLQDERKFIKVASATYTTKENILLFEEKNKKIIEFAKEWIQSKKKPISAFLIKEVLSATYNNGNFTLGLAEHVLSTNPEFRKVTKGFYDLANSK